VFDPRGGYFKKGKYTPSLVAEIGDVIERHLKMIGLIPTESLDERQKQFIEQKRREVESRVMTRASCDGGEAPAFPAEAQLCVKCSMKAVVKMDGCMTCLNCGDSKCG
jgi:hypothetical protein